MSNCVARCWNLSVCYWVIIYFTVPIYNFPNLFGVITSQKCRPFLGIFRVVEKFIFPQYDTYGSNITPTLMKTIFPESGNPYTLRSGNSFQTYNVRTVYNGTETVSLRGCKTWSMVPSHIKKISKSLQEFKSRIRNWTPEDCECVDYVRCLCIT